MKLIADFHIHSRWSRATSRELVPEEIEYWARVKGLSVVGTGDFTHSKWRAELKEKFEPAESGLYKLRDNIRIQNRVLPRDAGPVRFILSAEISCIYKKAGRVRKLHHVVLAPSLESAEAISKKLGRIGNLESDGRPILGLDSKDLLEIVLESDDSAVLVPAHIWTPWFSLFGSMSGFDAIEECFEDLTDKIFALETGLSSDPAMNWRLSALDRFSLVSNSDAHSPKNLAREACLFDCDLNYNSMMAALRDPKQGYLGTVEFFPEEGKYHYDGHRKCEVRFSPRETNKHKGICPVCKKPLTIGVMNRVDELADRDEPKQPASAPGFKSLIPLAEVIGELLDAGSKTKGVEQEYFRLVQKLGPELKILMEVPVGQIKQDFPGLALAIERMRKGEVKVEAGYDGEYGRVTVFDKKELKKLGKGQDGFFAESVTGKGKRVKKYSQENIEETETFLLQSPQPEAVPSIQLDPGQQRAVEHPGRILLIKAGPGTGKTRTLTHRIAYLIETGQAMPEQVLALTFTNQAAREMRERLGHLAGTKSEKIWVSTFHGFCFRMLKELAGPDSNFSILDQDLAKDFLHQAAPDLSAAKLNQALELIRKAKMLLLEPEQVKFNDEFPVWLGPIYDRYQKMLESESSVDFDDLILRMVKALREEDAAKKIRGRLAFVFVDEYQDLDFAQVELVKKLVGEKGTLCVIGDEDQAIYGFRGASPEFFNRFPLDFPGTEVLELKKSFRSSDSILLASSQALEKKDSLRRSGIKGPNLRIIESPTERSEAEFVIAEIERLLGGTGFFSMDSARVKDGTTAEIKGFSDLAVLFRTSAQAEALVEAFRRAGIPYQLLSESPLQSKFFKTGLRLIQIISGLAGPRLAQQVPEAKDFLCEMREKNISDPLELIAKAFSFAPAVENEIAEKELVKDSVLQLVRRQMGLKGIGTPVEIWETLRLAGSQDFYDPRADRVSLLTMHSAKGLEFEAVFLVGLEEGLVPHFSAKTEAELREEARLFYVALTRAKKFLYLSHARKRMLHGKPTVQTPSRFLQRIQQDLLDPLKPDLKPLKPKSKQLGLFEK